MRAPEVRVWEIPEGGLRRNMTEAVMELYGHSRRVGLIEWHPTSSGILFSAGYDYKVSSAKAVPQHTKNTHRYSNAQHNITSFRIREQSMCLSCVTYIEALL